MKKDLNRKVYPSLYSIKETKALPPPDPEKIKFNLESYRAVMGEFDFNETMKRLEGIPTSLFYKIDK